LKWAKGYPFAVLALRKPHVLPLVELVKIRDGCDGVTGVMVYPPAGFTVTALLLRDGKPAEEG
jgi:hypothetical protein